MNNFSSILSELKKKPFNQESQDYLNYHALRYRILLKTLMGLVAGDKKSSLKILDVGPSFQTIMLGKLLPWVKIDTLGLKDDQFEPYLKGKFFEFDLNEAQFRSKWPKIGKYDFIILAEVLEHLYTSPKIVIDFLTSILEVNGYLIIQTPNAVSLGKRKTMLLGANPFEMIRETPQYPGHFREYTLKELVEIGQKSRLKPVEILISNYFPRQDLKAKFYNFLCLFLPSSFRDGITIVFKK